MKRLVKDIGCCSFIYKLQILCSIAYRHLCLPTISFVCGIQTRTKTLIWHKRLRNVQSAQRCHGDDTVQ